MPGQHTEIRFPATHAGFAEAFPRLCAALDAQQLHGSARHGVELVFEELIANLVRYGPAGGHTPTVRVLADFRDAEIVLTFEDDGAAFDPRAAPDPPHAHSLEEARIGGYGLMLVRRAARSIEYERTADARNRVTVTIPSAGAAG